MKNKLLPILITFVFIFIFIIFYKGLKNTNIYTPEKKFNNNIPLFTADNKLMSIDRAHLTYFGARDIGQIIFSDIRLNDFR